MKQRARQILLILLSIGMFFPFYLIRQFSPAYRTGFDWLFHSDLSHIVARFIFYGILTWLASVVFTNRKPPISCFLVILGVLIIAAMQESIQLLTGQGPAGFDDLFDILIDMSGAVIGVLVFRWQKQKFTTEDSKKKNSPKSHVRSPKF